MTRPAKLETYKCGDCKAKTSFFVERCDETDQFYYEKKVGEKIHEDDVPTHDGSEHHSFHPDWQGDSTYWHRYEKEWSMDYIDVIECPCCGGAASRLVNGSPTIKHGRNSYQALKERQRYHHYGMDKKQGDKFLEESIEASKKRRKSGGQHYAKMVPNYEVLAKEGACRKLSDKEVAEKREGIKQVNRALTKDSTLGRGAKNKKS